mgnify:CR=1 FL=1
MLTFERPRVHPKRADKTFRVWISKLNDACFGKHWWRRGKGVLWARGIEFQRRGVHRFLPNSHPARVQLTRLTRATVTRVTHDPNRASPLVPTSNAPKPTLFKGKWSQDAFRPRGRRPKSLEGAKRK